VKKFERTFRLGSIQHWPILGALALGMLSTGLPSGLAKLPANQLVATISVGSEPYAVVVSPDSSTVYVVNGGSQTVSVINAATNQVTATIDGLGNDAFLAVISPDGSTLYVTNNLSEYISVISTASNTVTTTIPVQEGAQGLAISADGSTLYGAVASYGEVFGVDTAAESVTKRLCRQGTVWSVRILLINRLLGWYRRMERHVLKVLKTPLCGVAALRAFKRESWHEVTGSG
jgi:YVTN family beta-propeller protein